MIYSQSSHTILLTQPSRNKASRSYSDHETTSLAVEGTSIKDFRLLMNLFLEIIKSYEAKLKEMNPTVRDITYDIKDLYNYVDHFADIGVLV